jgi:hypothetical protein
MLSRLEYLTLKQTAKPLTFSISDKSESKLFGDDLFEFALSDYEQETAFYHQHNYGLSPSHWATETAFQENLKILSTETTADDEEFVNIYEGIKYPIVGFQFHPEIATSAMSKFHDFPHSNRAIYLNRYFADWFVEQARKNTNKMDFYNEETLLLIGNYAKVETDTYYGGVYLFESDWDRFTST